MNPPVSWSCGYGTNSTALAVGLVEHGESYDLAMFADTGGERPELYAYQRILGDYLRAHGLPPVMTVWHKRADMTRETLEQECLRLKILPSLAYGFRTCSQKHKIEPQEKVLRNWQPAIEAWKRGEKVIKLIGFDASEEHRVLRYQEEDDYIRRYPLIEWGWDREACVEAIKRAGLPQPGKSSCFFCPASKKHEILDLANKQPDLMNRALLMEKNAVDGIGRVKGLGRNFSWTDVVSNDRAQVKMFQDPPEQLCACLD